MSGLATLDWAVVGAYFALTFGVAWWAWWRERRERAPVSGAEDYFLANRNVGWFVVGSSIFATNIGTEHLVGLAGSGAASGVAVAQFEILASLVLLLLGWLFAPFYLSSRVFTMPEFMERRFSSGPRTYLAAVSVLAYVLTKASVTIFAGAFSFLRDNALPGQTPKLTIPSPSMVHYRGGNSSIDHDVYPDFPGSHRHGDRRFQVPRRYGHAEVEAPTAADDPIDVGRFE